MLIFLTKNKIIMVYTGVEVKEKKKGHFASFNAREISVLMRMQKYNR